MDQRQGGLFGTGDHHFLGLDVPAHSPRLGTMRRWTDADSVPPWARTLWPWDILRDREPRTDWMRVDPDVIEELVLGHLVEATRQSARALMSAADAGGSRVSALPAPEALFAEAIPTALRALGAALAEHFELGGNLAEELRR